MRKLARLGVGLAGLAAVAVSSGATAQAGTTGAWTVTTVPVQASYETSVQQPVNADGSSNFKANGKGVIPVKFSLKSGVSAFSFQSIGSTPLNPDDDASFVSFAPPAPIALADLTTLSAGYSFTKGNCHGGSLRWSLTIDKNDGSTPQRAFVYYGAMPNFTDCTTANQSNVNMRSLDDMRVDTTQLGGTFYDDWAHLATLLPANARVIRVSLVVDSGWGGDQIIALSSATVNDTTFTPDVATPASSTCNLPQAEVQITKISGSSAGPVNEPITIQPGDDDGLFRTVDCKYSYNLATSTLSGVGRYSVQAIVDGVTAGGAATFDLR